MTDIYVGIDVGGTTVKAATGDSGGQLLATQAIPTESHRGPQAVLEDMVALVRRLVLEAPGNELKGVGVGVPGLVDIDSGVTRFLPNLPTQWRNVAVADTLGKALNAPVRLMNDVRTATLGELRFGHGKQFPNATMAFFSIGTGVGGGVAIDGKIRLGPLGAAGELGHQTIIPEGPRCGCGNRGCLEALASATAIAAEGVRLMRSGLAPKLHEHVDGVSDRVTPLAMKDVADDEPMIHEVLVEAAKAVGIAAANVVVVLHPDLIVLGGGVAEMGELLTSTARDVIVDRVGMFPLDQVRVAKSQLGEQAGLVGAIALAIEAAGAKS